MKPGSRPPLPSKFVWIGSLLFFVPLVFLLFLQNQLTAKPLPFLGQISDFSLVTTENSTLTAKDLNGKIWVADFIFSTCAGPCPRMSDQMAKLHRSYVLEEDVRLVSITVHPEYDSPQVLKQYAAKYEADTSKWHFLTGVKEEIQKLTLEDFKIGSKENLINHSTMFVLVDRQSRIRGYYDLAEEAKLKKLFKDIALLLSEKS